MAGRSPEPSKGSPLNLKKIIMWTGSQKSDKYQMAAPTISKFIITLEIEASSSHHLSNMIG